MEVRVPARWRAIDRQYNSNALIVADLSRDDTYAEVLFEMFGRARDWRSDRSLMAMAWTLSGGQSNIAQCWSIP